MAMTAKFKSVFDQINSPVTRKIIENDYFNDEEAAKIAVVVEKILDKYTEGLNTTLELRAAEIIAHVDMRLGITEDEPGGRLARIERILEERLPPK